MTHRTFKANLYDLALECREERKAAALGAIKCLRLACEDLPARIKSSIDDLQGNIEHIYGGKLNPCWENVVGFYVEAEIDRVSSDYYGDYSLAVVKTHNHPFFKCIVTGPEGTAEWWPGCGTSETETMVSVGCWRHTIRRFFGLEAKGDS